ncbi:tyrosinase family protein [Paenibacillus turpanensis]|uniref:tyrosinase family protein n=1 Tax=Paenibacillus turpanensis TaxID=2689078 RepID=UPI0014091EF6|nr:tyrosinase family protein [Paenibacillus turpanensis]
MATIPNYPQRLLDEHFQWHSNMNMMNMRQGDGADFLRFHRDFMRRSLQWYNAQGLDRRSVAAWSSIPAEIRSHPMWNQGLQEAEDRITRNLASFRSSEELGRFLLMSSLHDSVHVIGAEVYRDPDFGLISLAPRSTLFYNWHGLIDRWWRDWQRISRRRRRTRNS